MGNNSSLQRAQSLEKSESPIGKGPIFRSVKNGSILPSVGNRLNRSQSAQIHRNRKPNQPRNIKLERPRTSLIRKSLPPNLQSYASSVHQLNAFWQDNVTPLMDRQSKEVYRELSLLFYMNLFKKIPEARNHFLGKEIDHQASQYMSMIGWLVRCLVRPDSSSLIERLRKLGAVHEERNVRHEWYPIMLEALHETLEDFFPTQYTVRIRFCMSQLFSAISDIMTFQDFTLKASELHEDVMDYIISLEACLAHPQGMTYLQLYMQQQFCVESILFYQKYRMYTYAHLQSVRIRMGKELMADFINPDSPKEINIAFGIRRQMCDAVEHLRNNCFNETFFDSAANEVFNLMRTNVWSRFQKTMLELSGQQSAFDEYKRQQSIRNYRTFATPASETRLVDILLGESQPSQNSVFSADSGVSIQSYANSQIQQSHNSSIVYKPF